MKQIILVITALSILSFAGNALAVSPDDEAIIAKAAQEYLGGVPADGYHIAAATVLERIQSGKTDYVLLDVRMPKDKKFDQGHLPGAIFIGFRDLANPENLAKLPKDKDIILYCDTGHEQNKALSVLRLLGYKAYDMKWGYSSWKTAQPTGKTLQAIEGAILNDYPLEK